ncbi:Speckle-type POZ protein-like isoform X2 [Aphelenchoides bicaudatus]|nr:Speckle-type POZ protein-like isoform X2 [Aphelenchoides bicaudatus]
MSSVKYKCTEYVTGFRWKIDNFLKVASRDGPKKVLFSEPFNLYKSRVSFCLTFEPTCTRETNSNNYSSLYLKPFYLDNKDSVRLAWNFWIENTAGEKIGKWEKIDYVFSNNDYGYGFSEFVETSNLYPPSNFVINDTITICCDIQCSINQLDFKPFELDTKFRENMWISYLQGDQSDECTIKIEDIEFKIKKCLLVGVSETFAQMFNSGLEESRTNIVNIEDIKPDALKAFIKYVYKGYLEMDSIKHVEELFVFSDKYLIEALKTECASILGKGLTKQNVLNRFTLATMHNSNELKNSILTYMLDKDSEGYWKIVMKSDEMNDLRMNNKQLADKIFDLIFARLP